MAEEVLKEGILAKRPIGKSIIKRSNLKDRLFVLTRSTLFYHEANEEKKKGREKGSVDLSKVRGIEKVADQTFSRPFCFQVISDDYTLYMFANDNKQRDEWIHCLRKVLTDKSKDDKAALALMRKYHDGAYLENIWTCCGEKARIVPGCKSTFISTSYVAPDSPKERTTESTTEIQNHFKVTAKFDFIPVQETDLALLKDQEYTVMDATGDKNWWLARDSLGREGYIPSNYVSKHEGIQCEKWYHGAMSRSEADAVLSDGQKDGTFVVHDSSRPAMYTLSFCYASEVKHYHIKLDQYGRYYVSQRHHFDTIAELIEYHKLNSAGLVTRLRFVYTGESEPPVILGHGIFKIPNNELKIQVKIGHGQFGTVHQASWKGKEKVAVKMMKEGTMQEHEFIEEARLMQRFKHKNLVEIYGISYCPTLSIVVELMQNGSLLTYLRNNKNRLSYDQLVGIVFQVSSAMMYLEGEKFLHRDLAARNCLVGNNNIIKVADFGLARYVLDDEYTASEGTKFPIRWAAPEVIDYTRFSSKSDVWAFGVLCWEVFSWGILPYPTKGNHEIVQDVRNGNRLSKPTACSEVIFELMKGCWEQTPEARPNFKEIYLKLASLTEDYDLADLA